MPVPKSTIARNYEEILKKDHGAEFMKVDLHIHTPASGDAQWKNRYNFKFNTKKHEESLNTVKKLAVDIINDVIGKQLRVIAVTDHNTPSNVHPEELKHTWYEHLKTTAEGKDLCVLPGIEISTDDMHILVILDPGDSYDTADKFPFTRLRIHSG
jgi:predicted metal-dependent phosphoesterase TrpH